jgi:hypothetical protein
MGNSVFRRPWAEAHIGSDECGVASGVDPSYFYFIEQDCGTIIHVVTVLVCDQSDRAATYLTNSL